MKGHGTKFGRKMEEAVAALLTQRNIEEAAKQVGISSPTLLNWMKQPEFQTAYREAKRAAFSQAIARLQQGSVAAATALLKTIVDPNTPASVRVGVHPVTMIVAEARVFLFLCDQARCDQIGLHGVDDLGSGVSREVRVDNRAAGVGDGKRRRHQASI